MPGSASSPGRTSAEGDEGTAATPLELGATDSLAYDMERVQEHDAQHIGGTEATGAGSIRGEDRALKPWESSPTRSSAVGGQAHAGPQRGHRRRGVGSLQCRVWVPRPAGDHLPNACGSNDDRPTTDHTRSGTTPNPPTAHAEISSHRSPCCLT